MSSNAGQHAVTLLKEFRLGEKTLDGPSTWLNEPLLWCSTEDLPQSGLHVVASCGQDCLELHK